MLMTFINDKWSARFRRWTIIAIVLTGISMLLNLVVDNPYTHQMLRILINEKITKETDYTIDFKALKVSAVPPTVDIFGFAIFSRTHPENAIARSSQISASLSLWSVIMGDIKLGTLGITDLDFSYPHPAFAAPKTATSIPVPAEEPAPWPPNFRLPIETIELTNARIYFAIPDDTAISEAAPPLLQMSLAGLDVVVDYEDWENIGLEIDVSATTLSAAGTTYLDQAKIVGSLELDGTRIRASRLNLTSSLLSTEGKLDARLRLNKMQQLETFGLKYQANIDADLRYLGSVLAIQNTAGPFQGKATVAVEIPILGDKSTTFNVEGQGKLKEAQLDGFKLGNSALKFRVNADEMLFDDIDLIFGDRSYGHIRGKITFDEKVSYDFQAQPRDLPLSKLLSALQVDFTAFDATLFSPELRVYGTGDPFDLRVVAPAEFHHMNFPDLAMDTSKFPIAPTCRLQMNLRANSQRLTFDGTQGTCFRYASSGHKPTIEEATAAPPASATDLSPLALVGFTSYDGATGMNLAITSRALSLGLTSYFVQMPLDGHANLETRIHGAYNRIFIDSAVNGADLKFIETPVPKLSARVRVDGSKVLLQSIALTTNEGGYLKVEDSVLDTDGEMSLNLKFSGEAIAGAFISSLLGESLNAVNFGADITRIHGQLSGPLHKPFAYQGKITTEMTSATLDGQVLFDHAVLALEHNREGWRTEGTSARLGAIQLKVSAKQQPDKSERSLDVGDSALQELGLDLNRSWEIRIDSEEPKLGNPRAKDLQLGLQRLPFASEALIAAGIDANLKITARLSGPLDRLQGTFEGSLYQLEVLESAMAPINFGGFLNTGAMDLMLGHGGNALTGRLRLDFSDTKLPYDLALNMLRFDLRPFATRFFASDPRNYAYMTGDLRLGGHFTDWWASQGALELRDLRAQFNREVMGKARSVQVNLFQPFTWEMTKKGWNIREGDDLMLVGDLLKIRVEAANNRIPSNLDIRVEGEVDARLASVLSSQVETASGKLRLEGSVTGPMEHPNVKFSLNDVRQNRFTSATWQPLSIGMADIRPPFQNINLDVVLTNDRLQLRSLRADKGNGFLTASGLLYFAAERQAESRIDLHLENAGIIYPVPTLKSIDAVLSGDIALTGTSLPLSIAGDITVNRARSTGEFDLRKEIFDALRKRSYSVRVGPDIPSILFDINIVADESIVISNRNIQTTLSSNLRLGGNDVSPNLRGQVEINKGKFMYKQDFTITQGMITFDDPIRPDPKIDILAEADVRSYRVFFAFSGRASDPVVDLSVEPQTREDGGEITKLDILSLLSKGSLPPARTNAADTGGVATAEVLNIIAGQFEEPVEKILDLTGQSIVRQGYIDTKAAENGQPVPRFNVPLNLGPNWDMVLRVEPNNWQMSSEYALHGNIVLQGSVDGREENETAKKQSNAPTDTGIDLKFRFSYP